MLKWLKGLAIGLVLLIALGIGYDMSTYKRKEWIADYAWVKRDMAQGYANLDWIVQKRGLDLVALDRETASRLEHAYSNIRAYFALRDFVAAFGDPHLELVNEKRPAGAAKGTRSSADKDPLAGADCEAAGYSDEMNDFHGALSKLPGWRPLPAGDFPAAMVGKVGLLRIGSFSESRYGGACQRTFHAGLGERQLQLATREVLQAQIRGRLEELRKAGATRLVVDLTGNGGGSEWATEAAALFSPRMLRRRAPLIVGPTCDRSGVWKGERPACPVFKPGAQEMEQLQGVGAWTGPVLILADGGTASAAEEFIVWLHGSAAATLAGERTMGAGCGYVDGGNPTYLRVAPLAVKMPNCARYLMDGTNEIEGVKPDVPLALKGDHAQLAETLRQALGGSF